MNNKTKIIIIIISLLNISLTKEIITQITNTEQVAMAPLDLETIAFEQGYFRLLENLRVKTVKQLDKIRTKGAAYENSYLTANKLYQSIELAQDFNKLYNDTQILVNQAIQRLYMIIISDDDHLTMIHKPYEAKLEYIKKSKAQANQVIQNIINWSDAKIKNIISKNTLNSISIPPTIVATPLLQVSELF